MAKYKQKTAQRTGKKVWGNFGAFNPICPNVNQKAELVKARLLLL
jgi:hypothetical protein